MSTENTQNTPRVKINWLLILQGWAMLWVVIGHAYLGEHNGGPVWETVLGNFAYSFHMPLFMFVSGWLFYPTRLKKEDHGSRTEWTYGAIIKDKAIRLILPGVVFTFLAFAVKLAFPGEVVRHTGLSFREIIMAFAYPYDNPFREMWFIVALFLLFVLTPVWEVAMKNKWVEWGLVPLLAALHFFGLDVTLFSLDRVCTHAIWFYLGLLISREDVINRLFLHRPFLLFVLGVGLYVAGYYVDMFVVTLGGIVLSVGLALLADKYIPRLFFSFRNYTYQIFLIGIFAQVLVKVLYRHFPVPYLLAYLLCVAMGLYVPVVVSRLIERINSKPLALCVGLKTL